MKKQESQKVYTYRGTKVVLRKLTYGNNNTIAIQMIGKDDEELYGTVTVNLSSPLQSDTLAFVDCNNMPGIEKWLQKNGIAISLGFSQRSGFCTYPLMMFTL